MWLTVEEDKYNEAEATMMSKEEEDDERERRQRRGREVRRFRRGEMVKV